MTDYSEKRFLVVENNPSFRSIIKQMLKELGVQYIQEATTANEVLMLCAENRFDLVLMDYDLGGQINGRQVLEQLRHDALLSQTSLIVMTSTDLSSQEALAILEAQPDAYLVKPFNPALFSRRLNSIQQRMNAMYDIHQAIDQSDSSLAIRLCQEQLALRSKYSSYCARLQADLLMAESRFDEAEYIYEAFNRIKPSDWSLQGLGRIKLAIKAYDQALGFLNEAMKKFPLSIQAYDLLAETYQAMDESDMAQSILQSAVAVAPLSVPRQCMLAEISWYNQNYDVAVQAFRKSQQLARHSIHEKPDHGLNLARCLADYASVSEIERARELSREAFTVLHKVSLEFNTDPVRLQSKLIESRTFFVIKKLAEASQCLEDAKALLQTQEQKVEPRIELEMARTYCDLEQEQSGLALLKDLLKRYPGDPWINREVDKIADEPISSAGKNSVKELNRRGAAFYKQQQFDKAIREFAIAQRRFPRHIGLKLNLVQAMLGDLENNGLNEEHVSRCQRHLAHLKVLQPTHKHYSRFINLRQKMDRKSWLTDIAREL